ncbi:MAG: hypothetical protein JXA42_21955 [Anaerolineales bacterium]|nr:hypothetical protein [Anaerolineales bacterium]
MKTEKTMTGNSNTQIKQWKLSILSAIPVCVIVLGLFSYWFALADRYIVFLYNHDMGPLYPDTSPFSRVTASRYWMAGLVASGVVLVVYTALNWLLGRLRPNYKPPDWRRVWAICAPILLTGLPAITMTSNDPPLPSSHAAIVTAVTLVGTGLALSWGKMAAQCPTQLFWLAADGLGLTFIVLNLNSVERVGRWLARGHTMYITMMVFFMIFGIIWLAGLTIINSVFRLKHHTPCAMILSCFNIAYLIMPLVHHIVGADGYYYISDSDNFFAQHISVQLVIWLLALGIAFVTYKIRCKFSNNYHAGKASKKICGNKSC